MLQRASGFLGTQDMTEGRPMSNLLKFSIPLLIGNFAQQMYATVDSVVVGHYIGDTALSAVGTTLPIINLLIVLFVAISTGVSIMVAQYFGARDRASVSRAVGNALILTAAASLLIMLVGIPLVDPLLRVTNTPAETFTMARQYLATMLIGSLGLGYYNITAGIMRGLGNTAFPLLVLLLASVLNAALVVWFVAGLGLGVQGAALATITAQGISALVCIWKLTTMTKDFSLDRSVLTPRKSYIVELLNLGLPAGLTQAIMSMSMVFVQSLTNSMGYQVVTTTTAVMRVDGFAMLPNFTFGMAIATYVGQNVGARRMDRVEQGIRDVVKASLLTSTALVVCLLIFSGNLIAMFTTTKEIIDLGVRMIRTLALGYIAVAISQVFGGIMRGAGDTMPSMWISLGTTVIVRVPVAYGMAWLTRSPAHPAGSPDALFFSLLSSWCLGAAATYLWYRRGGWRKKSIVKYDEPQIAGA